MLPVRKDLERTGNALQVPLAPWDVVLQEAEAERQAEDQKAARVHDTFWNDVNLRRQEHNRDKAKWCVERAHKFEAEVLACESRQHRHEERIQQVPPSLLCLLALKRCYIGLLFGVNVKALVPKVAL